MGVAEKLDDGIDDQQPVSGGQLKLAPRTLGRTGIAVSPICFGSLRLTPQNGVYKETLYKALQGGIRFVDTSGSYGNGAAEILIGEVLREYIFDNPESRDKVVLCTKLGLVQGSTLQEVEQRAFRGQKISGLYKVNERLSYCLSPEYIETQLTASLRRLQVERVDIVLIQNPEYIINNFTNKTEFVDYLRRAFEHLEVEVVKGRIRHYGISSSAFLKKEIAPDYLNIKSLYELAASITSKHHFSAIQFPFNLFETRSLFAKNQNNQSIFAIAKELNLGLLACRPLTSHHRDKVHHFITFPGKDEVSIKGKLHKVLMEVVEMEKELREKLPQHHDLEWGHLLRSNLHKISDWWRWSLYLQKQILPSMLVSIDRLPPSEEWNRWKIHYVNKTHSLFDLITDSLQGIANLRTNQICHYLNENCHELRGETKLSNKVTRLYLSLPEIHSIVMGLSDPQHVEDLLIMGDIPSTTETVKILHEIKMQF